MRNILVAIDFDENVNNLLENAIQLAKRFDSKVWILHIAAPNPDIISFEAGPQYIRDIRAEELKNDHRKIQNLAEKLNKLGVDAEGLLIIGPTVKMILLETYKLKIDLIIIGHNKHHFLNKTFFGTTDSEIIEKMKVPVLLIPVK